MIIVEPLKEWMLELVHFDENDQNIKVYIRTLLKQDNTRFLCGIDLTNRKIIAIAGLIIYRQAYVIGEWGIWLTPEAKTNRIWLVKQIKKYIDIEAKRLGIWRLIALVDARETQNQRFCEFFGFRKMRDNTIVNRNTDMYVYEREVRS